MSEEKTLCRKTIYEGRAIKLHIDTVRTSGGRETTREIVEHSDCVAIIAVDPDDNILLVEQFRKPVEKALLEIPAGGIEPGEEPEATLCRELREETGYLPRKVERLGGFYSAPGYCNEYLYLYLASDLVFDPLEAEDTEGISLMRIPIDEVFALISTGRICDAKSIAGLLTFLDYRKQRSE